jgi:hypothetical protein
LTTWCIEHLHRLPCELTGVSQRELLAAMAAWAVTKREQQKDNKPWPS